MVEEGIFGPTAKVMMANGLKDKSMEVDYGRVLREINI